MEKTNKPEMFQEMQEYSPRFHCRFRNMMKLARKELDKGKDVDILDAGCGTGTLMLHLQRMGYEIDGFDIDKENVAVARKRVNGRVEVGNVLDYTTRKKYDLIFCGEVLEHVENDLRAMKNIKKMLNNRGMFVISVPNDPNQWGTDDERGGHVRRYTVRELEKKLKSAGFTDFKTRYIGWPLVKRFLYGKSYRRRKYQIQKNPTALKKFMLRLFCYVEHIDDIFNTEKADKLVMSCRVK